jgi:hypothetical protein
LSYLPLWLGGLWLDGDLDALGQYLARADRTPGGVEGNIHDFCRDGGMGGREPWRRLVCAGIDEGREGREGAMGWDINRSDAVQ